MKYLIFIALALFMVPMANAVTYKSGLDSKVVPVSVPENGHAIFSLDVILDTGDVAYSTPLDVSQMKFPASADTSFLDAGKVTTSCYDVTDDGTATDSVNVITTIQKSLYSSDGIKPSTSKSDAWASLMVDTTSGESEAGALVESGKVLDLGTEDVWFLRVKLSNERDVVTDQSRCRVYWIRKGKY